jgi:filamentous hemagglutinin
MNRAWASFALAAAMLLGFLYLRSTQTDASSPSRPASSLAQTPSDLIVNNVRVYDLNGRLAYQGDVDLKPVLERIARGERDPHSNDGTPFSNREGQLPRQPRGYYTEYVVRTPGLSSVGPQRIILGKGGEIYYTPDHYATFVRVR